MKEMVNLDHKSQGSRVVQCSLEQVQSSEQCEELPRFCDVKAFCRGT